MWTLYLAVFYQIQMFDYFDKHELQMDYAGEWVEFATYLQTICL